MPRVNRSEIFADDEIQVFHCISRCVRRTMFGGVDRRTRRDFSHRKEWKQLRTPSSSEDEVPEGGSDTCSSFWRVYSGSRLTPSAPTEPELNQLLNDTAGMAERRRRLSNV
ncbi:MAG: hypothetical protein ACKVT0_05315, partial [Planctomycetaceae bacterium]